MIFYDDIVVWFMATGFSGIQSVETDGNPDRQERLLLNDPQALSSQLLTLQKKLEELSAKMVAVESEVLTIKSENSQLKSDLMTIKQSGGTVFIRWGRKDCPIVNGTQLIYSGIAGGAGYAETGSGSNTMCLPHDPDNSHSDFPTSLFGASKLAHVYGAEYQYGYNGVNVDDDVPCAVCVDIKGTTSVMIPSKTSCPSGWRKQYSGHICASDYHHISQTEYTCVDDNPQYFEGTRQQNYDGRLFYPAVTVCGSLPCPPYENSKYLKCVVCTKQDCLFEYKS